MKCTSPKNVRFKEDGKTITFSKRNYSKEYAPFQIPCGKCIACRLEAARQTAVRCIHEASMYERNSFITLTYRDDALPSNRLLYRDFQLFIKRLREHTFNKMLKEMYPNETDEKQRRNLFKNLSKDTRKQIYDRIRISLLVTGEYGDETKRPHWHAIIFNWRPEDLKYHRTSDSGDRIYTSELLDKLWGKNDSEQKPNEIGDVTFQSAGYVARYAAKKLVHGPDQEHDYHPIPRRSSKNAIGKKWLETYWKDVFNHGYCIIMNKDKVVKTGIPRYYEKWLKKHKPDEYKKWITVRKQKIIEDVLEMEKQSLQKEAEINAKRKNKLVPQISRLKAKKIIIEQKFKQSQDRKHKC